MTSLVAALALVVELVEVLCARKTNVSYCSKFGDPLGCAGTADIPVAEEAAVTAELMGNEVEQLCDVGVAGLHRRLAHRDLLTRARVLIVCADMEGALPSVVAGLVAAPVVCAPTSLGYDASFGGLAALLGMLSSCSPNTAVVNIDNGFGAACLVSMINRT
jgi:pyridinium-3,5-biscarboxylic acid mononucleotide synthase